MNSLLSQAINATKLSSQSDSFSRSDHSITEVIPDRTAPGIPDYFDETTHMVIQRFYEHCRDNGLSVNPGELIELGLFHVFLTSHVSPNKSHDIPCMFLWSEWVRFFLPRMRTFPSFIHEGEFRTLVGAIFGSWVVQDSERGPVFPGIHFAAKERPA